MKSLITAKNMRSLVLSTGDKIEMFASSGETLKDPMKASVFLFQNKRYTRFQFHKLLAKKLNLAY